MAQISTPNGEIIPVEEHIDVDDADNLLANSMSNKMHESLGQRGQSEPLTIFRVPEYIRAKHRELYEPQIVSIGPYHRGAKSLEPMQEQKWESLRQLLGDQQEAACSLIDLVKDVRSLEAKARSAYKESVLPNSNEFVEMMILDGCFIIQYLSHYDHSKTYSGISIKNSDLLLLENQIPLVITQVLYRRIFPDKEDTGLLSLLANFMFGDMNADQLENLTESPVHLVDLYYHWFLLKRSHIRGPKKAHSSPIPSYTSWGSQNSSKLGKRSPELQPEQLSTVPVQLSRINTFQSDWSSQCSEQNEELGKHSPELQPQQPSTMLVQLSRINTFQSDWPSQCSEQNEELGKHSPELQPQQPFKQPLIISVGVPKIKLTTTSPIKVIPSATALNEAGVKFKRKTSSRDLFHVTFKKGVIQIPSVILDNTRKRLFLNLIALEQSQAEWEKDLITFAKLMDMLIDTPKDVAILEKCGILYNLLASAEEATCFFNQICECATVDYNNNYLAHLIQDVRQYCDSSWHRNRATLMRDYFSNPWSIISFIAGILLLVCSVLQVYFAA
jgi:Plant protein of unknown function